jgi:hypothetical protein
MTPTDTTLASLAAAQLAAQPAAPALTGEDSSYPWIFPPSGFQAFDTPGYIPMPAMGSGDVAIVSFTVPTGWDGVIKRFSANQTGPGFVQGSGALIFRVTVNGQAVRGYDTLLTELGSIQTPRVTDGILISAGDVVELVINNASYAGIGAAFVVATLAGYFWPNG